MAAIITVRDVGERNGDGDGERMRFYFGVSLRPGQSINDVVGVTAKVGGCIPAANQCVRLRSVFQHRPSTS